MKQKYIILWCLSLLVPTITLSQPPGLIEPQIVNTGTLKIEPSTMVYFGGAYQNKGIHSNDGELYLNDHFINDSITASASGTTFFKSATNDTLTISGTAGRANFYNLEVNVTSAAKKGVLVDDGFGLFAANGVNLVSGDLRLVGEAQLIQTHSGVSENSATSGSLLKDQQGITSLYAYNYWSSPVTNTSGSFTLNGGFFDGTDSSLNLFSPQQVSFIADYDGIPATVDGDGVVTTPLSISRRWLYTYFPASTGYSGWFKIDENSPLNPGIGYSMKGTGATAQNYVFKGLPNDGTIVLPEIKIGEIALVGNPYPSAIDSRALIDQSGELFDELQIWIDGGSGSHYLSTYEGGYATLNNSGATAPVSPAGIAGLGSASELPKRYVAVGQGFFVEALKTGNITFNNSQRVFEIEDGINSIFYKGSNKKSNSSSVSTNVDDVDRRIWIGYEDPQQTHRQLLLGFLPNCSADLNYNFGYDAIMQDARADEVFYIIENDQTKKYLIQGVDTYDNTYEFPIGITITHEGNHMIMIDDIENFTDTVYIKDKVLNTFHNLSSSNFSPNLPPGEYLDRFTVVFQTETLATSDVFMDNNISTYYTDNTIVIKNENQIEINKITVFNILGQDVSIVNPTNSNDKRILIPFNQQKGVYIVLLQLGQSKKAYKIIN